MTGKHAADDLTRGERVVSSHDQTHGTVTRVVKTHTGPLAVVRADDGGRFNGYIGLSLEREGGDGDG